MPTYEIGLRNPYLIYDLYGGAHKVDEYGQHNQTEQVYLSGGDIYDDPYLLRFYQNCDTLPWENYQRKGKEESDPKWVIKSKFEDELAGFMLEKKFHTKGIGETLDQHQAMIHMLKGTKVLKDLLSHKVKLKKAASLVKLSEECLAVIQRSLPQKEGVPGILEMDKDELVPIILGRLFLATVRAIIDVHEGRLNLRVGNETITFNIGKSMKSKYSHDDYLYYADHTVKLIREHAELVEPLEWKAPENRLKPSSVEPPKLELKELPEHLKYAFLQEDNQLPVVISFTLSATEKAKLLEVLRNHKRAIA
ncbi:hypothetical protein Tco_0146539 [Tanacetum coccineum]